MGGPDQLTVERGQLRRGTGAKLFHKKLGDIAVVLDSGLLRASGDHGLHEVQVHPFVVGVHQDGAAAQVHRFGIAALSVQKPGGLGTELEELGMVVHPQGDSPGLVGSLWEEISPVQGGGGQHVPQPIRSRPGGSLAERFELLGIYGDVQVMVPTVSTPPVEDDLLPVFKAQGLHGVSGPVEKGF